MTDTSKPAIAAVVERLHQRGGWMRECGADDDAEMDIEAASLISALEAERDGLYSGKNAVVAHTLEHAERLYTVAVACLKSFGRDPEALISALEAERDGLRYDWGNFCRLMGVNVDTHEAIAEELEARAEAAEALNATLQTKLEKAAEALEPSADTKAAYMGEFTIAVERYVNEDGEPEDEMEDAPDPYEHIQVPWTTIKEIMAAIRVRSTLSTLRETTE